MIEECVEQNNLEQIISPSVWFFILLLWLQKPKPRFLHKNELNRYRGFRCPVIGLVSSGSAMCCANLLCIKYITIDDLSHCTLRSKELHRQSAVCEKLGVQGHNGR